MNGNDQQMTGGNQPPARPKSEDSGLGNAFLRGLAIGAGTLLGGPLLGAVIAIATGSGDGDDAGGDY